MDEENLIPNQLADMIERELFVYYKKGMTIEEATEEGARRRLSAWRKENANKSGRRYQPVKPGN